MEMQSEDATPDIKLIVPDSESKTLILCCECGIFIEPNTANMCVQCLRTHVDITENIPKQATLQFCRNCERYLQPPSEWIHAALESRQLLQLCLKKLKGLNQVKLTDAGFIWTEPHSKRLKVKLTVHAEVMGGLVLQQVFVVEFIVSHQMCTDCHRTEAKDFWRATVQVRHNETSKKTMSHLEQLILKHKAHEQALGIKSIHDGLDFFFANESGARKMVDFVNSVLPCRYQHSKKLISHDIHSNTYNYKFTYCVEIVPLSKDNVVCLPKSLTRQLGGINPICLVSKMASGIQLIDPLTAQIADLTATVFWRTPFKSIGNPKQLIEWTVMDVEIVLEKDRKIFPGQGSISNKHALADVWLVKSSELGINPNTVHTRTHLGHIINPGDTVLGYSLCDAVVNDDNFEKINQGDVPDVVLVKKPKNNHGKQLRKKNKMRKLKGTVKEMDGSEAMDEIEETEESDDSMDTDDDDSNLGQVGDQD